MTSGAVMNLLLDDQQKGWINFNFPTKENTGNSYYDGFIAKRRDCFE